MTLVKPSSFDIGRKGIHPSPPESNLNMGHVQKVLHTFIKVHLPIM